MTVVNQNEIIGLQTARRTFRPLQRWTGSHGHESGADRTRSVSGKPAKNHGVDGDVHGVDEYAEWATSMLSGLPDADIEIDEYLDELTAGSIS